MAFHSKFQTKKGVIQHFLIKYQESNSIHKSVPGGGVLTLEGGMGTCRPQDPLFQAKF